MKEINDPMAGNLEKVENVIPPVCYLLPSPLTLFYAPHFHFGIGIYMEIYMILLDF